MWVNEIILDNLTGPDAEACATFALYAVTYGNDNIKVINFSRTILVLSIMQKMHITFIQLSFFYRIINVASDY